MLAFTFNLTWIFWFAARFFITFATIHQASVNEERKKRFLNEMRTAIIIKGLFSSTYYFFFVFSIMIFTILYRKWLWKKKRKSNHWNSILGAHFFLVFNGTLYHKRSTFDYQRLILNRGSLCSDLFFCLLCCLHFKAKNLTRKKE